MNLNESSIPQNYMQTALKAKLSMELKPEEPKKLYEILFTSMSDFLRMMKGNGNKVALVVNSEGVFKFAGVVEYHENEEDKEMPGNFSYVITTDQEDLKDAKIFDINDVKFMQTATATAFSLHNMLIQQTHLSYLFGLGAGVLLDWLDVNASEKEKKSVQLDGYFVASVAVEEGEKVISIVPDGAMKRLIKDDARIEK